MKWNDDQTDQVRDIISRTCSSAYVLADELITTRLVPSKASECAFNIVNEMSIAGLCREYHDSGLHGDQILGCIMFHVVRECRGIEHGDRQLHHSAVTDDRVLLSQHVGDSMEIDETTEEGILCDKNVWPSRLRNLDFVSGDSVHNISFTKVNIHLIRAPSSANDCPPTTVFPVRYLLSPDDTEKPEITHQSITFERFNEALQHMRFDEKKERLVFYDYTSALRTVYHESDFQSLVWTAWKQARSREIEVFIRPMHRTPPDLYEGRLLT